MDKLINFVSDGKGKLPPGFRFQPTDEEIVFQYLACKVFSHPLPSLVIPEINIFSFDPCDLPGDCDQDRYFFSNGNINRKSGEGYSGHWKNTGSDKQIICSQRLPLLGVKRTMTYYHGNSVNDWVMHVYYLATSENNNCKPQRKRNSQGCLGQVGNWILCHVEKKGGNVDTDEDAADSSSAASSSSFHTYYSDHSSTGLTEVSSTITTAETSCQNF